MRLSFGHEFHERRTVTVLFADLVGSTSVGERLDVETHQALMTTYFDAMRAEAEAVGGTVEQFVGDAVLLLFGIPVAYEDAADRAVDAARRMLGRLESLNRGPFARHGLNLQIRIGINTGEVVIPATRTVPLGALAGDALNVAARLAGHAPPGGFLVSGSAARLVRNWRFQPVGAVELKGRRVPVEVFEVTGAARRPGRADGLAPAPITGRAHELSLLANARTRVEAEGRPHVVTIFGPAGIGKSRLTAEFAGGSGRGGSPARVLFGRCRPYGEGMSFGALAEILADLASVAETDDAAAAGERVGELVAGLAGDSAAAEGTIDALVYAAGFGRPESLDGLPAAQVSAAIR